MADLSLSEQLSDYIERIYFDQIPHVVVAAAKLHILDSLGCILAGSLLEPGRLAYDLAVTSSAGQAEVSLPGSNSRVSPLNAIQAMSTAAHCGEMDDIHGGAATCIGGMVVPGLLALAQKHGGSGVRLLETAIAGYETTVRVGLSIDAPRLFARGWWPSTLCGAFGVAAAGAKFVGWPANKIANALGIASLFAGGMLTGGQEGATARHLAFGRAAQNGMQALLAAEQGFSGPKFAFEDPRGFCMTLCAEPKLNVLTNPDAWYLLEVAFKPYPCARQLHAGVEALLRILARESITSGDIAAINLEVPTQNVAMVNRPSTAMIRAATLGSGQYVMAVTALRGKMDLASFEVDQLQSEDVRQMMEKVTVSASAELDRHFPKFWSGRVNVQTIDGRTCAEAVIAPKGESENPMTERDVAEKFLSLATPVIGNENAKVVIEEVQLLGSRKSLERLFEALQVPV